MCTPCRLLRAVARPLFEERESLVDVSGRVRGRGSDSSSDQYFADIVRVSAIRMLSATYEILAEANSRGSRLRVRPNQLESMNPRQRARLTRRHRHGGTGFTASSGQEGATA